MVSGLAIIGLGVAMVATRYPVGGPLLPLAARWQIPVATAVGFILAGTALVARTRGGRRLALGLTLPLMAGALVVLWQHLLWLPSDPNWVRPADATGTVTAPGFPTASTALCFLLAGLSMLLAGRYPAAAASLGIGVLALAILGMAGRELELQSTFVGLMSPLSTLGCALLGLGLAIPSEPGAPARADLASRYTPYTSGVTCLLATVLFWQSLVTNQRAALQHVVEMTAVGSVAEIGAFVTSITRALEHIAEEWNAVGRLPAAQWQYQSRLVLERLHSPRTVEWIDDDFDVVYMVAQPKAASTSHLTRPSPAPAVDAAARRALTAARATRTAVVTPTFEYDPDQWAFRLAVPLSRRGASDGFVSTLFLTDEMLDGFLAARAQDYLFTVYEGDRQLYGPRVPAAITPCAWCRPYTLDLPGGRSWDLWVRPSEELRATIETSFPEMILIAGVLISTLLTAALRLLERERRAARDLARINRSLLDEVASRRTAEQEIRNLAAELEQRVHDRTLELGKSNTALRAENALRQRAQATLESANSNLRHFASFVSHELRQPLAAMALWAELLESNPDVGLNDRGQGYLKQIRAAIDRMTSFLAAQLRLARATYTQPTLEADVDVAALIREVVGDRALGLQSAEATVEIGDIPRIPADSGQLRQLFRNLIENAVKYRRPDVPLRIQIDGSIVRSEGARHCELRVSDNGQGFAASDAEKVFDLFEQLPGRKSTGTGSGVGLAICRRIVEHHRGTIRAEGRPGAGATFVIDLPLEHNGDHATG